MPDLQYQRFRIRRFYSVMIQYLLYTLVLVLTPLFTLIT